MNENKIIDTRIITEKINFYQFTEVVNTLIENDNPSKFNVNIDEKLFKNNESDDKFKLVIKYQLDSEQMPIDLIWRIAILITFEKSPDYKIDLNNLSKYNNELIEKVDNYIDKFSHMTNFNIPNISIIIKKANDEKNSNNSSE